MDFPGYAIGGLAVGEPKALMHEVLELLNKFLPKTSPVILWVGHPLDMVGG